MYFSCSRIPIQLDWIFIIDVFLSHHCLTLRCASWLRIISDKMDAHCQTLHRSCFARKFMAVVVDNGIRFVYCLRNIIERFYMRKNYNANVSGVLICVRAIIQYLNIKRGWRLLSGSAQERLLFFY